MKKQKRVSCLNQLSLTSTWGWIINLPKPIVLHYTVYLTTTPTKVFSCYHSAAICILMLVFELVVGHQSSQQNAHSQVWVF